MQDREADEKCDREPARPHDVEIDVVRTQGVKYGTEPEQQDDTEDRTAEPPRRQPAVE